MVEGSSLAVSILTTLLCAPWQTAADASSFLLRTGLFRKINTQPLEDAYAATKWVAEHAADVGGDPHRIAVGGDGSGGNLAAVVTLMARERATPDVAFQLLIYPMLDATIMRPGWWTESSAVTVSRESKNEILGMYLPTTGELRDPFVSPIFAKNLKNLASALVITDEDDPMRDEGEDYVARLTQDGVAAKVSRYPHMIHGFFLMAGERTGSGFLFRSYIVGTRVRDCFRAGVCGTWVARLKPDSNNSHHILIANISNKPASLLFAQR